MRLGGWGARGRSCVWLLIASLQQNLSGVGSSLLRDSDRDGYKVTTKTWKELLSFEGRFLRGNFQGYGKGLVF